MNAPQPIQVGRDLAISLLRSRGSFARVADLGIDSEWFESEMLLLEAFATSYAALTVFGETSTTREQILEGVYVTLAHALGERWPEVLDAIHGRFPAYVEAAMHPHPQFGLSYAVASAFASRLQSNDIAVISIAAECFSGLFIRTRDHLDSLAFGIMLESR